MKRRGSGGKVKRKKKNRRSAIDQMMARMEHDQRMSGVYNTPLGAIARQVVRDVMSEDTASKRRKK